MMEPDPGNEEMGIIGLYFLEIVPTHLNCRLSFNKKIFQCLDALL